MFTALKGVSVPAFQGGLRDAEKSASDTLLNLIGSRLGLDHDRVLGGRYALTVMSRYVSERGASSSTTGSATASSTGTCSRSSGRYAGSTESS